MIPPKKAFVQEVNPTDPDASHLVFSLLNLFDGIDLLATVNKYLAFFFINWNPEDSYFKTRPNTLQTLQLCDKVSVFSFAPCRQQSQFSHCFRALCVSIWHFQLYLHQGCCDFRWFFSEYCIGLPLVGCIVLQLCIWCSCSNIRVGLKL